MEEQKFELDLRMSDGGIVCNATALKAMLPNKLKSYNYVVDANNYVDAKKDRSKLNNLIELLQEKRKQFEEVELGSWKKEKSVLMEIEKDIKDISDALGDGVKAIDEEVKIQKMESIRQNFNAVQLPMVIGFEKLYDRKKYDPKAMTEKKIMEDMQTKINKIIEDHNMMKLFLPDDPVEQEQIKMVYRNTLEIGKAKEKADELAKLHKKVAEKNIVKSSNVQPIQTSKTQTVHEQSAAAELYTRTFKVINCTRQQIIDLGNYMNANNIKFEKVEEK